MANHVLQYPVFFGDPARPAGTGATVTVTSAVDDSAAECFSVREGGTAVSNVVPVVNGFFRVYVPAGRYNLAASYQGKTIQLLDVEVGPIEVVTPALDPFIFDDAYSLGEHTISESGKRATFDENVTTALVMGPSAVAGKVYIEFEILDVYQSSVAVGFCKFPPSNYVDIPQPSGFIGANYDNYFSGYIQTRRDEYPLSNGDIIMIAVDFDNTKIWFGHNGAWLDSGNPAGATNPFYATSGSTSGANIASFDPEDEWRVCFWSTTWGSDVRILTPEDQVYTTPAGFNV